MIELREYNKGDEENIFKLWERIFGNLLEKNDIFKIGPEWWSWRVSNPNGQPSIFLGVDANEIIAHQMIEAFNISTPAGRKRIYSSSLTMSNEKYRGLTLLKLLNQCTKKISSENALGYGLPNENSLFIFEKFKWKNLGNIPILIRPLHAPFKIFDLGAKAKGYELKSVDNFGKEIDEFMNSTKFPFDYFIERNSRMLNWKYVDNPLKKYEKRILIKEGKVEGYAVFRNAIVNRAKMGIILDILAKDSQGFNRLLNEIIRYFSEQKLSFVSCFMINNGFFYKILKKRGFIQVPILFMNKRNAFVVLGDMNEQNFLNIKKWYISYGDWDCL